MRKRPGGEMRRTARKIAAPTCLLLMIAWGWGTIMAIQHLINSFNPPEGLLYLGIAAAAITAAAVIDHLESCRNATPENPGTC